MAIIVPLMHSYRALSAALGRSPDAEAIYNQYLEYYNHVIGLIDEINHCYPAGSAPDNVQKDLSDLSTILTNLEAIYNADFEDSSTTLDDFIKECESLLVQADALYVDAMGGGLDIKNQINRILSSVVKWSTDAKQTLLQYQDQLATDNDALSYLQGEIAQLQAEIDSVEDPQLREKAQEDLNQTIIVLVQMEEQISNVGDLMQAELLAVDNLSKKDGVIDQLQQLADIPEPTEDDLTQAQVLQDSVNPVKEQMNAVANLFDQINSSINQIQSGIRKVKLDLNPLPPSGNGVEDGAWYIDWTMWFGSAPFPIPEGVNNINMFVGTFVEKDGHPSIDGFGNMSLDLLDAFVKQCHEHDPPIKVKVSVGGGGGAYDHCWDAITAENVEAYADGIVQFCHNHNVDGVDFDYETYDSPEQETLVGTLIRLFKQKDPALETSLCANAGFDTWVGHVKNVYDASVDPDTGKCMIDRYYIMAYYNSIEEEKVWVNQWADWLMTNYDYAPEQVAVGIDDFDAHAYDPDEMKAWARNMGYSTCHWAYDPARPSVKRALSARELAVREGYVLVDRF